MRNVVVFPHPDGPSNIKNSPSSIVKLDDCTAVKAPKSLRRFLIIIWAKVYSGKLLTMMNITVPVSVTRKE